MFLSSSIYMAIAASPVPNRWCPICDRHEVIFAEFHHVLNVAIFSDFSSPDSLPNHSGLPKQYPVLLSLIDDCMGSPIRSTSSYPFSIYSPVDSLSLYLGRSDRILVENISCDMGDSSCMNAVWFRTILFELLRRI